MSPTLRRSLGLTGAICPRRAPGGFTLVELLVAVGVLGLLAAITLPAIQASREASRRMTCSSHLHQLVVANQNHVATHGYYAGTGMKRAPFKVLLPFVEAQMPTEDGPPAVEVYQCPAEPHSDWGHAWSMNYLANHGSHIFLLPDGLEEPDGLYSSYTWKLQPRDVTDGESHTAMFSERLLPFPGWMYRTPEESSEAHRRHPLICLWRLGESFFHGQEDAFLSACRDPARRQPQTVAFSGPFQDISNNLISYDHVLPPNSPGCRYIEPPRPYLWTLPEWSLPATSAHPGGVTLALCDGAAKFISEGIDVRVWRALGTRNGGESTGSY